MEVYLHCFPFSDTDAATRCLNCFAIAPNVVANIRFIIDTGSEGLTLPGFLQENLQLKFQGRKPVITTQGIREEDVFLLPELLLPTLVPSNLEYLQVPTQFNTELERWDVGLLGANLLFRQGNTTGPLWQSVRFENAMNRLVFVP